MADRAARGRRRAARGVAPLVAFALAAAAIPARFGATRTDAAGGDGPVVKGEVGRKIEAFVASPDNFPEGFCGCLLAARAGAVLLAKSYGLAKAEPPTPLPVDALWDWASVTKQFTSAALLKLESKKKLSLGDPLSKLWNDVPKDKAAITLRQLLDHTSGLDPAPPFEGVDLNSREAAVAAILEPPLKHPPGTAWEYNNAAYFLAAAILERAAGTTFENFVRKELFEPSGMKDAGFIGDGHADHSRVPFEERGAGGQFAYGPRLSWGYRGAGGALASVFDMLRWDQAMRGDKILSKTARARWYTVGRQDYALGWEVRKATGGTRVEHGGKVGKHVTYYMRGLDEPIVIAIAYSYEPKEHPKVTMDRLWTLVHNER
jgi:CubicO group peptidase (beta-lactamase class C family)